MSGLKIRGQAGGSVELQVSDTLTTDEVLEVPSDIITHGNTGSIGWTKFPDGTMIVNGYTHSTTETDYEVPFGVTFDGIPAITITPKSYQSDLADKIVAVAWSDVSNSTHIRVVTKKLGIETNFIAIGRWK